MKTTMLRRPGWIRKMTSRNTMMTITKRRQGKTTMMTCGKYDATETGSKEDADAGRPDEVGNKVINPSSKN